MRTEAAKTASAIKSELKKAFPRIKFRVRSSNFAGGDSVSIRYENGVPYKEIEKITDKYQYGNFNGMEDIYESDNRREDIPQAKYVQVSRHITENKRKEAKKDIMKKYGFKEWEDQVIMDKLGIWSDQLLWEELKDKIL